MNLRLGGNEFRNVQVPVLWGTRAILMDKTGKLSIIDLGSTEPRIEILGDEPAPRVAYAPLVDGISILGADERELYRYDPKERTLYPISLRLPECEIGLDSIRIGFSVFGANSISGAPVGLVVREDGISLGAPLPAALARL